jgi:hypothetical protein
MTPDNTDAGFEYSEAAKTRFVELGMDALRDFTASVPRDRLIRIAARLPKINGFRPAHVADEQIKRLARRLTIQDSPGTPSASTAPAFADSRDWQTMLRLWIAWCSTHFEGSLGHDLMSANTSVVDAANDPETINRFQLRLEDIAASGDITREELEQAIAYSPFADVTRFLVYTRNAPTRETIEKERAVLELGKRVKELESKVIASGTAQDSLRAEVLKRSSATESLLDQYNIQLKKLESEAAFISDIGPRLIKLEEESVRSTERLDDAFTTVDQCAQELRAEIGVINDAAREATKLQQASSGMSASRGTRGEPQEAAIAFIHEDIISGEGASVETPDALKAGLAERFYAAGLSRESADEVSLEVAAAAIASQQIAFRGSLAQQLLEAARSCFPGLWETGIVPVGLGDPLSLYNWHRTIEVDRSLSLIGVNHSAFEIYGQSVRSSIAEKQVGLPGDRRLYLAAVSEGPGSLPLVAPFVELGPIIDSDSLTWRTGGSRINQRMPEVSLQPMRSRFDAIRAIGDSTAVLEDFLTTLSPVRTALARQSMIRAFGGLLHVVGESEVPRCWRSLFYAWVFPQMRAVKISRKQAQDALVKSTATDALSTERGARLLARLSA